MNVRFPLITTAVTAALFTAPAHAGPINTFQTWAQVETSVSTYQGNWVTENYFDGYSGTGPYTASSSTTRPIGAASGSSSADWGVIKTYAAADASTAPVSFGADARSWWFTQFSFINEALTGQTGFATLKHYFAGTPTVSASDGGNASNWQYRTFGMYDASLWSGQQTYGIEQLVTLGRGIGPHVISDYVSYSLIENRVSQSGQAMLSPAHYIYLPVEFVWGQTYTVYGGIQTNCRAEAAVGQASCTSGAGEAGYWAGVGDVRDASGNTVDGYQVRDADGRDLTVSLAPAEVPEPGATALLLAGMAAFGAARRRKQG